MIEAPNFRLPARLSRFGRQLAAGAAYYQPPSATHPGGYLLTDVRQPEHLDELESVFQGERPLILTPRDTPWLEAGQCFVASEVDFAHLVASRSWQQYSSTAELIRGLRNPSLDYGATTRVTVHARFVQPVLDITLLLLGMPLVLSRRQRNLFVAAAQCLGLVAAYHLVLLACHALGSNSYLVTPALSAWLPLMVFGPLAYVGFQRRWE